MNKRKAISKKVRQSVYLMYNGHCAYCGTEIAYKDMQVDHATPLRIGGADDISNYMPACRSCNHYKATLDVEGFRRYLSEIACILGINIAFKIILFVVFIINLFLSAKGN